jgi:hypothetical protein
MMVKYPGWWIIIPYWLLLSQVITLAWAFRPKKVFHKFDFLERAWPLKGLAVIVGISALVGFIGVFQMGYTSALEVLPDSVRQAADMHLSAQEAIGNGLGGIVAVALCYLIVMRDDRRRADMAKNTPSDKIGGVLPWWV